MQTFRPIEFEDFNCINDFLSRSEILDTAYSATVVKAWQSFFNPKIHIDDDFIVILYESGDMAFCASPLVKERGAYIRAVEFIEQCGINNVNLVTDWQAEILGERGYALENIVGMAEYLYGANDLIELSGKKYHSKRNFINSFHYRYVFREYTENDYGAVMELMDRWNMSIDLSERGESVDASWSYILEDLKISDFDLEKDTLKEVLKNQEKYNILADVLEIDGKIAGFAAGETMTNGVGAIYFEKADTGYKGIYPMLDNLFIKKRFQGMKYVNKQEDMGIEGLRKSKMSYHPLKLIERFNAKRK